jgi:hypothetical protein
VLLLAGQARGPHLTRTRTHALPCPRNPQRLLRVERAFPVHETMLDSAANDGINVEMDPTDQFKVRDC